MCGGGPKAPAATAEPSKPTVSPMVQEMIDAITYGPSGYSDAMKANVGLDKPNPGYQGGPRPTSGMASGGGPFNYTAKPMQVDPLKAALAKPSKPPAPKPSVTASTQPSNAGVTPQRSNTLNTAQQDHMRIAMSR